MSVEVDYTIYLRGITYTKDREELERKGYTVIPDSYNETRLNLKKKESRTMVYKNLIEFISSFESDLKFNYVNDYFLDNMEICINKIRIDVNLSD